MTPAEETRELFAGKHTPGPWGWSHDLGNVGLEIYLDGDPNGSGGAVIRPEFFLHLESGGVTFYLDGDNRKHDFPLIEAAPDLLEALRGLLVEYCQHIPEDVTCPKVRKAADTARAAIAKAEGQQ